MWKLDLNTRDVLTGVLRHQDRRRNDICIKHEFILEYGAFRFIGKIESTMLNSVPLRFLFSLWSGPLRVHLTCFNAALTCCEPSDNRAANLIVRSSLPRGNRRCPLFIDPSGGVKSRSEPRWRAVNLMAALYMLAAGWKLISYFAVNTVPSVQNGQSGIIQGYFCH